MKELPPRLKVLYPFTGRPVDCAGEGRLHVLDEGEGPTVVMLHGNPTWSFFYRDLVLDLRRDHRCVVPDHLGCGLSDMPEKGDYTLSGHIRRTVRLLELMEVESFHLVVHDWGGAIGFGVASALPEKIKSISILNTAAFPFPSIPKRIALCRVPVLGPLMVRGLNGFVEAATRMTTVTPLSEAVREGYRWPYASWAERVAVNAFVKDIPMRPSHRSWRTLKETESSLVRWREKRVGIFWGMRDWCFHTEILEEWKRRLPESEVREYADAGHYLMEDCGGEIIPDVRSFLDSGSQRP